MKTIGKKTGTWLTIALAACMGACNQDPSLYGGEEETPGVLTITPSTTDVELNSQTMKPDQEVLTVTWNEAAPRGPYDTIVYVFKTDLADNAFGNPDREEIGRGVFSKTFTYQGLYDLLTEKWRAPLGASVGIDLRIIATVWGPKFVRPETATTRVNVKIFMPDPKPIYLFGSAVPNADTKVQMRETVPGKEYIFEDSLSTGSFIFVTDTEGEVPAYAKGASDTLLKALDDGVAQPADSFSVSAAGRYNITVRIDKLTAKINKKVVIAGKEWALANVSDKGVFADTPDAPGKFFQFHYDIAYSATDPISPAWQEATDKEDTYWRSATVPCPDGWAIPEGGNLESLAKAGYTWAEANTKGNAVAGGFFGPDHATAHLGTLGNYIFIPAAGRRDSQTGELKDAGVKGYVHSKNPFWGETSQTLVFDATGAAMVYAKAAETGGADILLGTGMSVRCIKN